MIPVCYGVGEVARFCRCSGWQLEPVQSDDSSATLRRIENFQNQEITVGSSAHESVVFCAVFELPLEDVSGHPHHHERQCAEYDTVGGCPDGVRAAAAGSAVVRLPPSIQPCS